MRYFSTFSGIGGFELGIGSGFPAATCVGFSEIDKHAIKTYEEHFDHENYGDITAIDETELPDFDLFVGGFPCQAFSVAGKRRGFDEARGTLFFDVARILEHKRPRHLVLENVKGLLNHDQGKTFEVILGILAELGYDIEWCVLNSKDFGVPQNRERVYIVGHLGGQCGRKIFPLRREDQALNQAGRNAGGSPEAFIKTRHLGQNGRLISESTTIQASETPHVIANTLRSSDGGVSERDTLVVEPKVIVREATKAGFAEATVGDSINVSVPTSKTRRGRVQKNLAGTLQTGESMVTLLPDTRIRRLTPRECERLQGFPDDWTIGSDTQRYKQCGNAVTTNVVAAVIGGLRGCLDGL